MQYTPFPRHQKTKKTNNGFKKIIIIAIIIIFSQFIYRTYFIQAGTDPKNSIVINIPKGAGLSEIAEILKENNIISSKILFKIKAKSLELDKKLQPGLFRINLPQNLTSVLNTISKTPEESKITIPEGYKISQIDSLLASQGLISKGDFINCVQNCILEHPVLNYIPNQTIRNLEGFLFPDTYFISQIEFKSEDLILKMLDNFQNRLPQNFEEQAQKLPLTDLYSIINMASIIEREVLSKNEKQMVSGILWKRYKSDWLIDADAALLYEKDNNIITRKDLQSNSPYNIRKFKGLPPTPISNPGIESIQATLNPIDSNYWFYITTLDTGRVIYAETLEQHNANINKYLR